MANPWKFVKRFTILSSEENVRELLTHGLEAQATHLYGLPASREAANTASQKSPVRPSMASFVLGKGIIGKSGPNIQQILLIPQLKCDRQGRPD